MKTKAPKGQVWVCGACGKVAKDRYEFNDSSCVTNSVLCVEESVEYKNGVAIKANAAK